MAGTIAPAATINGSNVPQTAGQLNINGNYTQTSAGTFNLGLGGLTAGTQFGFLGISGNALIDGTLNVNLLNTFFPAVGDTFTFLTTGGTVTGTFSITNGLNIGRGEILNVIYGSNFIELATAQTNTTDLWLGGIGNWSNAAKWSIGVPTPPDDTFIYSGGNDLVTMDVGSSTVNSLAVGGASNGFTSELTDGSVAQTLSITNGLSVGQQGILSFTGNGSSITAATVSNNGSVTIGHGATLNLTGQPLGVTSVLAGSSWTIGGNFEVGGVANTGFSNLSSVSGSVIFENGASQTIGNSLTNNAGGFIDVDAGSTLTITGNVTNNAGGPQGIYTGFNGTGDNTLNINGNLTNNGKFGLESAGDIATVGGNVTNNSGALFAQTGGSSATFTGTLLNGGTVDLENGSSLNVNGATTNNGTLSTSGFGGTGGNTMTFASLLTNTGTGQINVNGPSDVLKASAGLVNMGTVTVKNGSTIDPPS
jgi:fibronectin-binding autotransporter adhesin